MSKSGKDGVTKREHLQQVQKQTGQVVNGLRGPKFPSLVGYIWSAFLDLSNSRSAGMAGPDPISYTEIRNYMDTTGSFLSPEDVKAVKRLDTSYMRIMSSEK